MSSLFLSPKNPQQREIMDETNLIQTLKNPNETQKPPNPNLKPQKKTT